ncbi:MAG: IclR family transcriptional regulator [Burkholderiales bacterium]|nr:IclR family transcriptional regulator [Burkholderiales bacterium]
MNQAGPGRAPGSQSIGRAVSILKLVAARAAGARYVEVMAQSGLEAATAHRILRRLVVEGLVQQREDKRYCLGPLAYELGLAASAQFDLRRIGAPSLERLSRATGDTSFLTVRSGVEAVCLDRREGTFPVKALTVEIGSRRPLGTAAASLALLYPLPDAEITRIVRANEHELTRYGALTRQKLMNLVRLAKRLGYALNADVILPGVTGIGVPIPGRFGYPTAALSIVAISSRLRKGRRSEALRLLREEAQRIAAALSP